MYVVIHTHMHKNIWAYVAKFMDLEQKFNFGKIH